MTRTSRGETTLTDRTGHNEEFKYETQPANVYHYGTRELRSKEYVPNHTAM